MTSTTPDLHVDTKVRPAGRVPGRLASVRSATVGGVRALVRETGTDTAPPPVDVVGEVFRAVGGLAVVLAVLVGAAELLAASGGIFGFQTDLVGSLRGAVWVLGLAVGSQLRVGVAETATIDLQLVPLWVTGLLAAAAAVPAWRDQRRRPSTVRVLVTRTAAFTVLTAGLTLSAVLLSRSTDQFGTAVGVDPLATTAGVAVVVGAASLLARVFARQRSLTEADPTTPDVPWLAAARHLGRVAGVWAVVSLVAGCVAVVLQTASNPDDSVAGRLLRDLALLPNLLARLVLTGSGAPLTSRGNLAESGELFAALDLGGRSRVTLADVNPVVALVGLVLVAAGPLVVAVRRYRAQQPSTPVLVQLRAGLLAAGVFALTAWLVRSVTSVQVAQSTQGDTFGLSASSASRVGVMVAAGAGLVWVGLVPVLATLVVRVFTRPEKPRA